jgi:penicillin-binding protein 2
MMNSAPPPPGDDPRRPAITPQLALRVAVLGGIAFVLFAIVFFRLWYLEILSGDQYVSQANDNRVREIRIQAPRGDITDRNGATLVTNRQATIIQLEPGKLPKDMTERKLLFLRLGKVLRMDPVEISREVNRQRRLLPYANVTLKLDAPRTVLNYLQERKRQFPSVTVTDQYVRRYPHTTLAAQLLGTVGQIDEKELKLKRFKGVKQGTIVGQSGVEWEYDRYLRGRDGAQLLQVDSMGGFKGELRRRQPVAGSNLKLSLDLNLQKAGQEAVATAGGGRPGAFVAMDPRNGEMLAMGSFPSYDPSVFSKPLTQKKYRELSSEENGAPLFDRATGGLYPTGSTFKPITALAALANGVITPDTVINDPGCLKVGIQEFCNAGKVVNGSLSLRRAIQVSSDVFFYTLGRDLNGLKGQQLQSWAHKLGLGRHTGIDLPSEGTGLVPDRQWREEIGAKELACRKKEKVPSCGISDARPWSVGDNINLSVGQGDLQASPLQMAVAYAALSNGGKVVRPHLGLDIEDSEGRLVQEIDPPAARKIDFPSGARSAILDGLHAAASAPGGTSTDVFKGWPQDRYPVYGKTGTAERPPHPDQSWYVAFVPDKNRPIVVAVTIEGGGFGAEAAAPAARQILSQWFFGRSGQFIRGDSHTR